MKNNLSILERKKFIILIVNSSKSNIFNNQHSQNITCSIHKKDFISIDVSRFKIFCSQCNDNGDHDKFLEFKDEDNSDEETQCQLHPDLQGCFYCNDCKIFLCKVCFANEHRNHKSNLPEEISVNYKSDLKKIITDISSVKPRIEESLKSISEIDKKIKSIRETSLNKMKSLFVQINTTLKNKYELILKQYDSSFEGLDEEMRNLFNRIESLQKKFLKHSYDVQEVLNYLTNNSSMLSEDLCEYKKGKKNILIEIRRLIEDSENIFNFKIVNTKKRVNEKIDGFNKETEKFLKQLQIYEKSVLNSVHTGISSSSLRLRRFNKFSKNSFKFYKTSSLVYQVNKPICLVGLGLCGLFLKKSGESSPKIKFPISVEVSQISSDKSKSGERPKLLKETHYLSHIVNTNDPTFVLYFHKAITIKPGVKYLVTLINEHKDSFLELWCGEVAKIFLAKMTQFIHCNTSGVHLEFYPSEGIESDFNEFNIGLIADFIFSATG